MPTKDEVLDNLAAASVAGGLGLFVGAGFSRALTWDGTESSALSWRALLEKVATEMALALPAPDEAFGKGFPRIASDLVQERFAQLRADPANSTRHDDELRRAALSEFKNKVANAARLTAQPNIAKEYRSALEALSPAWIITTNYDLLIEETLPGTHTLLPQEVFAARNTVPVYHLHGHRFAPDSIVITEEDYVSVLRSGDYRHSKLPLLLTEATTLFLGYGLGDINVLTALESARVYSRDDGRNLDIRAVLANRRADDPAPEPYVSPSGATVIDIADICDLITDLAERRALLVKNLQAEEAAVAALLGVPVATWIARSRSDRQGDIELLTRHAAVQGSQALLHFLDRALEAVWSEAREDGGFAFYARFLETIIDALSLWTPATLHPSLAAFFQSQLAKVAYQVDPKGRRVLGKSYEATNVWRSEKSKLLAFKPELLRQARELGQYWLEELLE